MENSWFAHKTYVSDEISGTWNVRSKPAAKILDQGLDTSHKLSLADLDLGLACVEFSIVDINMLQKGRHHPFPDHITSQTGSFEMSLSYR
jgi:hypothetical protein